MQIFGGLVLGCIKTKFCKKICVRQHFSSSTRFASFCTASISKFSQKIGSKNQQFLRKLIQNSANVANHVGNLQNFAKFQKFRRDNLVDFEKCCKMRIFLQKSVPIQPKTSNILPKFCRSAVVSPTGARRSRPAVQPSELEAAAHPGDGAGGRAPPRRAPEIAAETISADRISSM